MKFRTEYKADKASFTLNPQHPIVLAGSCFSQNIARKMEEHGWTAINPLGTLYNPISICFAIDMMLDAEKGTERFEQSLFEFNGIWNSNWFDSSFSSLYREECVQEFLNRRDLLIKTLKEGKTLIVTFGTSLVYHRIEDRIPVGNCHKQPSGLFYQQRMTSSEVLSYWDCVIERLREQIPDIRLIFTVSPVRHLKDGFTGNSKSKAILLLGVEDIIRYNERCHYFPAYEILNDDLRDYRFYASDLSHPSEEAIDYIWEKFVDTYIEENGLKMLEEGRKKYIASQHRPKLGALGHPLEKHT